jgi:hypothetical protein
MQDVCLELKQQQVYNLKLDGITVGFSHRESTIYLDATEVSPYLKVIASLCALSQDYTEWQACREGNEEFIRV